MISTTAAVFGLDRKVRLAFGFVPPEAMSTRAMMTARTHGRGRWY